jgi:hypothetical protein
MRTERLAAAGFSMLVALVPASFHADMIWEVENARANARAGGPVSAYDAELLDRWGCLSGSRSAYCRRIRHGANSGGYRAKRRRRR